MTKAEQVLKEIEKQAEKEFLPIIGPRKGKILVEAIQKVKPKHILEVGTLVGYSAILMGKELTSDAHLVSIEIHADEAKTAEQNIERAEIPPRIEVLVGDARAILPKLKEDFDLVFIDAEKREYLEYLKLIEDRLHKGSVLVADNVGIFADQMRDYLNHVRDSGKYESMYIRVGGDGVEASTKL